MPLPNPNFVALFPLQEQIWDKDLNVPLADGYILFFQDAARTIPKDVFVQTQAPGPIYSYTNIGSQVTLSSIGTTAYLGTDSIIFLFPYDSFGEPQLYYIEVFSSTNILQFVRSGWPPLGVSGSGGGSSGFSQSSNIISNPQFSKVLFNVPVGPVISVTGTMTTQIAPDWSIITTGTGTVTVNQIAVTDATAPGEPSFALDITSTGLNAPLILNQRIFQSPRILENNFASGTFIVEAVSPTSSAIVTMNYVPSLGNSIPIVSGTALPGVFTAYTGTTSVVIPQSNTQSPLVGFVDIQLVIPVGVHIQISCIQLVSALNATTFPAYVQESVPRQVDHLFHYYLPQLSFRQVPSMLTGWDFPLNPMQFGVTSFSTTPIYVWDQTICGSAVGTVNVTKPPTISSFQATTTNNSEAFFMLQYLKGNKAVEITLANLAVNITAFAQVNPGVVCNVYLYYTTNGGVIPSGTASAPGVIGTIAANGVFTLTAANWVLITQGSGNASSATMNNTNGMIDFGFTGWNQNRLLFSTSNTPVFAIVVTFSAPTSGTVIQIESISLTAGDIPARPAPQTFDQVLRECQHYYEKSYATNVFAGASGSGGTLNQIVAPMGFVQSGVSIWGVVTNSFGYTYNVEKRAVPNLTLYSTAGTINNVSVSYFFNGTLNGPTDAVLATFWTSSNLGAKSFSYISGKGTLYVNTGVGVVESFAGYNFVADARLGIV